MKRWSWRVWTAVTLTLVLVVSTVVVLLGNSWTFEQRSYTIATPEGGVLDAVLTTPKDGEAVGVVVMVHGDGAVDATQGDLYNAWFDGAARSRWATLSWSKPGVGASTGDWLEQTMDDRATEVSTAIDWARHQGDIPTARIVLWGASQAGWVLPKIVAQRDDIAAVVAVGTAINWLRQGRFNREATLDEDDATAQQRSDAERDSAQTNRLLAAEATYDDYRASTNDSDPMSRARWGFVSRNFRADATEDLRQAARRDLPWHLMVGNHDHNVDVAETADVYSEIFGDRLTVAHFDSVHSMARPVMENSEVVGLVTAVIWPRALLAPGVIDDCRRTLSGIDNDHG